MSQSPYSMPIHSGGRFRPSTDLAELWWRRFVG
jgi:hypothetical protein